MRRTPSTCWCATIFAFAASSGDEGFHCAPGGRGEGPGARRFNRPRNLAIGGGLLVVADTGNERIQAFGVRTLALRHVWTGADVPPPSGETDSWRPVDVATRAGISTCWTQVCRVFRLRAGKISGGRSRTGGGVRYRTHPGLGRSRPVEPARG